MLILSALKISLGFEYGVNIYILSLIHIYYHSIVFDDPNKAYDTGIEIKILGITVYENTTFYK